LMYVSPYFWQILVFLYHKRAVSDKCWSQIRSVYLIRRNICYTEQIYYIENPKIFRWQKNGLEGLPILFLVAKKHRPGKFN
jgi:hypothetical protein